jgi:hypothetical protein
LQEPERSLYSVIVYNSTRDPRITNIKFSFFIRCEVLEK